jgi:hypothetical protein
VDEQIDKLSSTLTRDAPISCRSSPKAQIAPNQIIGRRTSAPVCLLPSKLRIRSALFAVLYTTLLLRQLRREWGPINGKHAEAKSEAVALFGEIQALVDSE